VGLFQPTADAKRLFELVQLQLERLRIGSPVTAVHVAASLNSPLEPRKQATLFELDGDSRQPRRLAALVERLSSRLGSKAVLGVRLRPEAQPELSWHYEPLVGRRRNLARIVRHGVGWVKQTSIPGGASVAATRLAKQEKLVDLRSPSKDLRDLDPPYNSSGTACKQAVAHGATALPPRPLRLLPRPLRLVIVSIAPDGPPLRFQLNGQEHAVARSWGPERIETGWWRGRAIGRDYFRVEIETGCRYWLFRRLRDGKWFLHGVFD
jgi:protein ImuB